MFENLFNRKKEEQQIEEAQEKEHKFVQGRDMFNAAVGEQDDYMIMNEQRNDLLKWQQDLDDEMEKLKHRLRSEVKTEHGWKRKTIIKYDEEGNELIYEYPALANDIFVDHVETLVEPFLSRNLINSNFNEDRILQMLKDTMNDIVDSMADNYDNYGIDFSNFDIVVRLIKNVIIPGPFRALNDGQRRHDRSINKRVEAFNDRPNQPQQKKGMLGVFN